MWFGSGLLQPRVGQKHSSHNGSWPIAPHLCSSLRMARNLPLCFSSTPVKSWGLRTFPRQRTPRRVMVKASVELHYYRQAPSLCQRTPQRFNHVYGHTHVGVQHSDPQNHKLHPNRSRPRLTSLGNNCAARP